MCSKGYLLQCNVVQFGCVFSCLAAVAIVLTGHEFSLFKVRIIDAYFFSDILFCYN